MPKLEDLEKLGSIAFLIGDRALPPEISQDDYNRFKSVFTDERLSNTVANKTDDDLPSIDDIDNIDNNNIDQDIPSLEDLDLPEDIGVIGKELDSDSNIDDNKLDDLGLPEDLIDMNNDETSDNNFEDNNIEPSSDIVEDINDSDIINDDFTLPRDIEDIDDSDIIDEDTDETSEDISDNLNDYDTVSDEDINEDLVVPDIDNLDDEDNLNNAENISDDLPEATDIDKDKIDDMEDILNGLDASLDNENDGLEKNEISNAMDDIFEDEAPIQDNKLPSEDIPSSNNVADDDLSILDNLENTFGGDNEDVLENNMESSAEAPYNEASSEVDYNIETPESNNYTDEENDDINDFVLDDLDSSLPSSDIKEDNNLEEYNDDVTNDISLNAPEEIDSIEEIGEDEKDENGETSSVLEGQKVLPPPSLASNLGKSKYEELGIDIDINRVLDSIKELPALTQHHVLDAILNEKLSNEDMKDLLDALDTKASFETISEILKRSLGLEIKERAKHSVLDLIPVPASLKDYASIIRIAAVFFIGLFLLVIFSYQFVYKPIRANQYYNAGMKDISNGLYEEAERNFSRGERLKPKQMKWYNNYAKAYIDRSLFPLALQKIQSALNIKPRDFDTRMTFGYYYRKKGENDLSADDYSNGENIYNDLLRSTKNKKMVEKVYDERGLLMISRAKALNEPNYYDNAYNNYRELVSVNGDSILARKRAMLIRIYQDRYEQVKALEERINNLKKGYIDDEVYPVLAKYLLDKNDFYGARVLFEKLIKKYPNNIESIVGYADYEARLKHYDKARDILINVALPLYDKDPYIKGKEYVYNMLGQIYYNIGEYGNATRQFQNAIAIDSGYPDANYNLGNVYFYQDNNYKKAKEYYQTAYANLHPNLRSDQLLYNLSWLYYLDGEYDSAFEGFYSLFQKDSSNSVVSYALGNSLLHLDKASLANGFYRNALSIVMQKRAKLGNLEMRTDKDFYLISYLAGLYNNIGVSYAYNYTDNKNIVNEQEAFANFVLAAEYFDQVRTSNIDLQMRDKRTVMLDNQNVGVASYNLMAMQTRRNLKDTVIIDNYIPKDMYYVR